MTAKPKVNSEGEKELERAKEQFDKFDEEVKSLTNDRMNMAPKLEVEPQTKLSQKELEKSKDIYLKPKRMIGSKEKFNEKFRDEYNYAIEYVCFIAENREIVGETIELWTKPFPGMPAQEWAVPTNKPVWGPRHLAERLKACIYHRLKSEDQTVIGGDERGNKYTGSMVVDHTIERLTAMPATPKQKSIFMGAKSFS
jgi:hypothetical protein